jgi:integrase
MCTFLTPPRNGTYYFRRAIPERLRPIIGQREFFFSLGVKDREAAKRLLPQHAADTQRQLDEAQAQLDREVAVSADPQAAERAAFERREAEAKAKRWTDRAAFRDYWRKRWALSTAEMSPEEAALKDLYKAGELGPETGERLDALLKPVEQERAVRRVAANRRPGTVTLGNLFIGYSVQAGVRPETVKQFRAIINHLIAFLDHDDAAAVTAHDLVRWRNHLQQEEVKPGKVRAAKTINDSYMATANVVFGYGVDQMLIPANPMKDVAKLRAKKAPKLRDKDFTKAERKVILSAAMVMAGGRTSPKRAAARRWVPWLCAYTGARVNEMTQLRAEDVQQDQGVWAIRITPEAGEVKTNEARWVPLHEHLIEQGFLTFVEGKRGALFYDQGKMVRGTNKRVGMWLAAWVRELGIKDPTLQPNHAWRHTFKTICTEVGIAERAADYMQGHASKGVGRTYGSNSMAALSAEFAKFPRFGIEPD